MHAKGLRLKYFDEVERAFREYPTREWKMGELVQQVAAYQATDVQVRHVMREYAASRQQVKRCADALVAAGAVRKIILAQNSHKYTASQCRTLL